MSVKQLCALFTVLLGLIVMRFLQAGDGLGQIISFDDEEVEVRVDGEIDYWPAARLGQPPIVILEKDTKSFVKIDTPDNGAVWVSLSYVTTHHQATLKKNCQSQQLAQSVDKQQFGVRGIGESCQKE